MSRTLGRILLVVPTLLVALGVTGSAPAAASGCDEAAISLSCTSLVPAPAPEPEPEPAPEPAPPPEPPPPPAEAPATEEMATDEQAVGRLRSLIDAERRSHGLEALAPRSPLSEVAAAHSRSMAERGELWHNDDLFTAATKDRLGVRLVGENVASNVSIDDAHRRLMASAGHRANLLSASFLQLGLGVARAGNTWFITEVFATPVSPGAGARPTPGATGVSPSTVRSTAAPASPAVPTDRSPTSTSAPAPAGAGAVVAVRLDIAAPSVAALASPAPSRPVPARSSPPLLPILVGLAALAGVMTWVALTPSVRTTLETYKTAALSTFRAWTRRPLPLRAAAGPRPRRLGAR